LLNGGIIMVDKKTIGVTSLITLGIVLAQRDILLELIAECG